ncbi:MAG: AzlC family ABC transporter permease [Lachnospiraceae bacterium]|nr:AzlC family ABC transporter permease [Lachnospiraceae bacterium]
MTREEKRKSFLEGIRGGLPIGLGYFPVSFTLGIMSISEGLNWWEATMISLFNMTSAGQFSGLTIMAAGGTLIEMALNQFVINLRYALMSITLSQKVDDSITGGWRFLAAFSNTDEIFAMGMARERPVDRWFWEGLSIPPILGWTLGTAFGALLGSVLPQRLLDAFGIAIYGMFVAIIIPQARKSRAALFTLLLGAALSCCFYYVPLLSRVPAGFSVIICAVAAACLAALLFPVRDEEKGGCA